MSCSEQERCPLTNGASLILTDCRKGRKKSAELHFIQWAGWGKCTFFFTFYNVIIIIIHLHYEKDLAPVNSESRSLASHSAMPSH